MEHFLFACAFHLSSLSMFADVLDGYGSKQDRSYTQKVGRVAPKAEVRRRLQDASSGGWGDEQRFVRQTKLKKTNIKLQGIENRVRFHACILSCPHSSIC